MVSRTPASKFWVPFAVCCALAPFNLALAQQVEDTEPLIMLAVAQYPAYGLILGLANRLGRWRLISWIMFTILALVAVLCLVVPNQNF